MYFNQKIINYIQTWLYNIIINMDKVIGKGIPIWNRYMHDKLLLTISFKY